MDFLKKAKASLKDLEADLNKATASLGLGIGNKDEAASTDTTAANKDEAVSTDTTATNQDEAASTNTTAASTTMNTPASSVAPSVVPEASKAKLPLAVRKNLRDNWETRKLELEAKISELTGVPWTAPIDVGMVYGYAIERYAKENTGEMLAVYLDRTAGNLEQYLTKFGQEGKEELNELAFNHTIVLEPKDEQTGDYSYDIRNGSLRILFSKQYLGYNLSSEPRKDIATAVNNAGIASSSGSGSGPTIDFDARSSIRFEYEPQVGEVKEKIEKLLALPVLTLTPNFEHNFAALAKHAQAASSNDLIRDWQKRIGSVTLSYFEGLAGQLEHAGFGKDEMLQEGLQEAVEKNEIQLRVVDKLVKKKCHEVVIENGVLIIQTVPNYWNYNIPEVGEGIMDLL